MKQIFTTGLLIVIAGGLFFAYIGPTYGKVQNLQAENGHLSQALDKSRELQSVRDSLRAKYNTFTPTDLERLQKLLPDHIDNIRLILDVNSIAAKHNLTVQQFSFSGDGGDISTEGSGSSSFGSILFQFSVSTDYNTFREFMRDLEKSLRVIDIVALTLDGNDSGKYSYGVTIRTYWLQ